MSFLTHPGQRDRDMKCGAEDKRHSKSGNNKPEMLPLPHLPQDAARAAFPVDLLNLAQETRWRALIQVHVRLHLLESTDQHRLSARED